MIKLDIFSDPVCPWCLIGKAALDAALAQRPDHPLVIEWHPFRLNPDMPPEGMDRRVSMERKFGGAEGVLRAYAPVVERAEAMGLDIDLAAISRTPNTLDAHRLIHWAGLEDRQDAVVNALFDGFFRKGLDIGDRSVLVTLAQAAGMEAGVVARLLASDSDTAMIEERDSAARARGITGVPCFILANRHAMSGAQPTELWLRVIDEVQEKLAAVR